MYLSALLFPTKSYHALDKDYKTNKDDKTNFDNKQLSQNNNPLTDCIITQELFDEQIKAFYQLPHYLQSIFYQLLKDEAGFAGFFKVIAQNSIAFDDHSSVFDLIKTHFAQTICQNCQLDEFIKKYPIGVCFVLALIDCNKRHCISPSWLIHKHQEINYIFDRLRATPCQNCTYCNEQLNAHKALKNILITMIFVLMIINLCNIKRYNRQFWVILYWQSFPQAVANPSLFKSLH